MEKIKFYCVTNKKIDFIKVKDFHFAWVGQGNAPESYLCCNDKDNIYHKEKNYSELTFHYWFWKNLLHTESDNSWIGFCQKRRYWAINSPKEKIDKENINQHLMTHVEGETDLESIICEPITTSGVKKIKLIKRGWRNIIKDPLIFFDKNRQNIKLQFDMHHGFGNLESAIKLMNDDDRNDFSEYVKKNTRFNPHIMFISKKKIIDKWFNTLFKWLENCEKEFGFKNLKGYDKTRIYAYLAERYLSFWFKKYTKYKEHPWIFIDV